jgi:hypothetical protein
VTDVLQILGQVEIAKLSLNQDDVLVIKTDRVVSNVVADRIRNHIKPLLPRGVQVMIINPDIELSVLTRSEIDAKVA